MRGQDLYSALLEMPLGITLGAIIYVIGGEIPDGKGPKAVQP